jgi:flavin reductase (DIM6/NTAB) family NADH-FMN oxidoreductase RutF
MHAARAIARPDSFRECMARLAATVHIVTAVHEGRRFGVTMTAASSLSADPMSIIISIKQQTATQEAILRSRRLCLNMLGPGHDDLAVRFSGTLGHRGDARFAAGDWVCEAGHPPMLNDAAAALQCELADVHAFGTHDVMLCTVRHIRLGQQPASLVYANRRYGTVQHIADELV